MVEDGYWPQRRTRGRENPESGFGGVGVAFDTGGASFQFR